MFIFVVMIMLKHVGDLNFPVPRQQLRRRRRHRGGAEAETQCTQIESLKD